MITEARREMASALAHPPRLKVQFSGYPFEPTGYGTAARAYVHALVRAGLDLSVQSRSRTVRQTSDDPLTASLVDRPLAAEFCICHAEPPDLLVTQRPLAELIALTTWESEILPEAFAQALNQVREVWAPSRYNVEAFRRQLKVPVFHLPHAVSLPSPAPPPASTIDQLCGLDAGDFVFLTIATWQERKNLAETIAAFFRAFPDQPGVKLVLKTSFNFVSSPQAVARILEHLERLEPKIDPRQIMARLRIVEVGWPAGHMESLMRRANCYLSLHRSEGWCYPLFDAACAGTPVVATGYSGPMDYLDPNSHHLVDYQLVPADRRDDPQGFAFSPQMSWAAPDSVHAAAQMQDVYQHYPQVCQRAEFCAAQLRERYSYEAVGAMARARLTFLAQQG